MILYDKIGIPTAYSEDGEHIYLFTGQPAAYLYENAIYGFNGHQFGWFENGWVRDLNGYCVFFSENANGSGPVKPVKHICPVKNVKRVKPVKQVKAVRRMRAVNQLSWSQLSGAHFFNQ